MKRTLHKFTIDGLARNDIDCLRTIFEKLEELGMCCGDSGCGGFEKAMRFQRYFRALHCPARWNIIRIIGEEEKGTGEILKGLRESGEALARSSLYYHLSELEEAGIIETDRDTQQA